MICSLRLMAAALIAAMPSVAPAGFALPDRPDERAEMFSNCIGILSAHLSLHLDTDVSEPKISQVERAHQELRVVLELTRPAAEAEGMKQDKLQIWEASAWLDHVRLTKLSRNTTSDRNANQLRYRLAQRVEGCVELIIPS